MRLKRYEVIDLAGAISQVKCELGLGAIVLSTRIIHKSGGLFRLAGKPLVEVIAVADRRESQRLSLTGAVMSRDPGLVEPALAAAELAAVSALTERRRVGLITLDAYRTAAEQL